MGMDHVAVAAVFDQVEVFLHNGGDGRQAIAGAVEQLDKLGWHTLPFDSAVGKAMEEVPEPNRTMLREHQAGKSYVAIAEQMGEDKVVVRRALARTYADLRMRMMGVTKGL
jgi:DNA-directed RNA polymerase specialized sigma24 family protein